MKYYLAPMEGITGYVYRNAYEKYFGNIDTYFTPFLVPNQSTSLKTKEIRDVLPENNKGMNIVPQILTNNSEGFIATARKLQGLGYKEINLRGLKLVKHGGYFITCSCSHYMNEELLKKTILEACQDANKLIRQVEFRTQSCDHPILWNSDESYYLKFFIFQVFDKTKL